MLASTKVCHCLSQRTCRSSPPSGGDSLTTPPSDPPLQPLRSALPRWHRHVLDGESKVTFNTHCGGADLERDGAPGKHANYDWHIDFVGSTRSAQPQLALITSLEIYALSIGTEGVRRRVFHQMLFTKKLRTSYGWVKTPSYLELSEVRIHCSFDLSWLLPWCRSNARVLC
jgi:hypothetical protein